MSETPSSPSDRRAQSVAFLGFLLQLASFGALFAISLWSESDAIAAVARFMVIGLPIWLVLFLVFKQMRRVEAEGLETEELRRAQETGTSAAIFEVGDENLLLERSRLRWQIRWMLPAVTVVLSIVLLVGSFLFWGWSIDGAFAEQGLRRTQNPVLMMWFVVGAGFFNFLYARYALTLARLPDWRLLRAGGTCMAGNALICLLLAIALATGTSFAWAEPLLAYIVRGLLIILGIEFAANFVLDFYRPRGPDVIPRPSFESRLLSLLGEPGSIAKSIAEAINYQFGFEVSSTWFYQLLQRCLFPLMMVTALVILLLTSVVIVGPDERVVIERFGRPVGQPQTAALDSGIHLKWPFPIDMTYRAPVKRISELVVGEAKEEDENIRRPILWTEEHEFVPELMLIVGSPKKTASDDDESSSPAPTVRAAATDKLDTPVSLLKVSVPIEYRIKDIHKFLYRHVDPVKTLESIAYQFLSEYAAGVDMNVLMGPGRETFNRQFHDQLQRRLDEPDLDLGIEVVFTGIRGAHPPAEAGVAKSFEETVSALHIKAATINAAEGKAVKILTAVAGSTQRAEELDAAILAREKLSADREATPAELQEKEINIEQLFAGDPAKGIAPLSGDAATQIEDAKARATAMVAEAANKARAFATEVAAYQAAPTIYTQRKILQMFEGIGEVRKFLIVGNPLDVILIYKTEEEGGLDRVLRDATEEKK